METSNAELREALDHIIATHVSDRVGEQIQQIKNLARTHPHSISVVQEAIPVRPETFQFNCYQHSFELLIRNTLETILDSRQLQLPPVSKFSLKVDTFINDHIGSKLGSAQAKLLADEMKLLWEVCSKAAHPNPPDYFNRLDANFIVRNTTAILEYVSRLLA